MRALEGVALPRYETLPRGPSWKPYVPVSLEGSPDLFAQEKAVPALVPAGQSASRLHSEEVTAFCGAGDSRGGPGSGTMSRCGCGMWIPANWLAAIRSVRAVGGSARAQWMSPSPLRSPVAPLSFSS